MPGPNIERVAFDNTSRHWKLVSATLSAHYRTDEDFCSVFVTCHYTSTNAAVYMEFLALPVDGYRHEASRGRLIREPPPGDRHGEICARIVAILSAWLQQHPVGRLRVGSGVLLSRTPLTGARS